MDCSGGDAPRPHVGVSMAQNVCIVSDSAADIGAALVAQNHISIVPLVVRFGRQSFLDGELSLDDFWQRVEKKDEPPATSQPSVGAFEDVFGRLVDGGSEVLCLTITRRHSGTYNCATAAARRFGSRVRVMDSRSLSLGQGFQVLAAARAALQGLAMDEIVRVVERVQASSRLYLVLDTIEFIRRGGRVDALVPMLSRVTNKLHVKPILHVVGGKLSLHGLAHSYERALIRIEQAIVSLAPVRQLAVVHVRAPGLAQKVAERMAMALGYSRERVVVTETGPLLAAHAGPKVVGVAAVQSDDSE